MDANERTIPKLGFSAQEVADAIGVARSFLYEMNKTGEEASTRPWRDPHRPFGPAGVLPSPIASSVR